MGQGRVKARHDLQDQLNLQLSIKHIISSCSLNGTSNTGPSDRCSQTGPAFIQWYRNIDHLVFPASLPQAWLSGSPYPCFSCRSYQKPFPASLEAACFSGHPYPASSPCFCLCHSSSPCQTPFLCSWLYHPACCPLVPCSQLYCFFCYPVGCRSFWPVLLLAAHHQPLWYCCLHQLTHLSSNVTSCCTFCEDMPDHSGILVHKPLPTYCS